MTAHPLARALLGIAFAAAAAGCSRPESTAARAQQDRDARQEPASPSRDERPLAAERRNAEAGAIVPAGTEISARLNSTITSASAVPGEIVEGELAVSLMVGGRLVADVGAPVEARVESVVASGHLARPARLVLVITSLQVGGQRFPVVTSRFARSGRTHTQRNTRFIGGGAAIGAIVGQLLGKNRDSTLRGAALGAAAGTGAAAATGKLDVSIGAGEVLLFTLEQPLSLRR